ncbi:hypothetical protein GCM10018773_30920 [Streptomyces candidus]|nr:hypothetical protein GCM10018773_30920 [Streptomyces candidus]
MRAASVYQPVAGPAFGELSDRRERRCGRFVSSHKFEGLYAVKKWASAEPIRSGAFSVGMCSAFGMRMRVA